MLTFTQPRLQQRVSNPKSSTPEADIDARGLERALKKELAGEVRFGPGSRALYATDGSNYRQVPIGVVIPRNAHDVEAAFAACHRFNAPVLCRGGGTTAAAAWPAPSALKKAPTMTFP